MSLSTTQILLLTLAVEVVEVVTVAELKMVVVQEAAVVPVVVPVEIPEELMVVPVPAVPAEP
jgi:hypothetical protein